MSLGETLQVDLSQFGYIWRLKTSLTKCTISKLQGRGQWLSCCKAERPWQRVLSGRRLPKAEKPLSMAGEAVANGAVGSMLPNYKKGSKFFVKSCFCTSYNFVKEVQRGRCQAAAGSFRLRVERYFHRQNCSASPSLHGSV